MTLHNDIFYENLTKDVMGLSQDERLITGQISDNIKEGIDLALNSLDLTTTEKELLENRYTHAFTYEQCGSFYNVSHQKARADIKNIIERLRASSKYEHFFHGVMEGDYQEVQIYEVINKQRDYVKFGVGFDKKETILGIDLRYMSNICLDSKTVDTLYRKGCETLNDLITARNESKIKLSKCEDEKLDKFIKELNI